MRKLAVMGAVSAAMLGAAIGAQAATDTYVINGTLANSINSCFNIAVSLTGTDCSYARTRVPPSATASGPKFVGAFYSRGSIGDNINYNPIPDDGKLAPAVSGTVTIDDNGTPADGTDDLISATWIIAAAAFNASTGNGDRAIEHWDTVTQVMAPTAVNAATASGSGFEYVIGSRTVTNAGGTVAAPTGLVQTGKPTPDPLCGAPPNEAKCFPSESAPGTQDPPGFWDTTFAGLPNPADNRIGIERSVAFGLYPPGRPEPNPNPNIGATTTGTFTGYVCIDIAGDNDCISSESLFGSSQITYRNENGTAAVDPALGNCADSIDNDADGKIDLVSGNEDPECISKATTSASGVPADPNKLVSPPGYDNLILVLTTDGAGAITRANAYWTREYIISSGPSAGTEPAGTYTIDNSYQAGLISFTGAQAASDPSAVDDSNLAVIQDTATVLNVLANDTLGGGTNVITIEGAGPTNGTAVPGAANISYTPGLHFSGTDTFQYRLTDDDNGTSVATVTVTVSNKLPVAGNFTASSRNGAPSAAIPVLSNPTVLGTGTAAEHIVTALSGTLGTCAVSGTGASQAVQFTPTGGNGTGGCDFQIEDADGDTDTGTLTVSVSGTSSGGGGGGSSGPQLPSGGSSLDLLSLGALLAGLPLLRRRRQASR